MKTFIFAIGGTGSRVLRSLSFMLATGMECLPDGCEIVPMIVDYDKHNGDKKRAVDNLELYCKIRNRAYDGYTAGEGERNFFLPDIMPLSGTGDFVFPLGVNPQSQTGSFADALDYSNMMGATTLTRDLLSTLYNDEPGKYATEDGTMEDNSRAELNLDMEKGFKGNPNIGCIVFEDIKGDPAFARFKSSYSSGDRIFIIASVFGGTGSSGFPRIVDAIRSCGIAGLDTAPIGALLVMPYFKLDTPTGGAIFSNIFNSKQKAALHTYQATDANGNDLYSKINRTYLIADDNPTLIPYSEGQDTQKNNAHIVELLGAFAVIDFIRQDAKGIGGMGQTFEYGLAKDKSAGSELTIHNFANSDRTNYLDSLTRMALAWKYFKDHVWSGDINPRSAYYSVNGLDVAGMINDGDLDDLAKYIDEFEEWLDELNNQKDAFRPFLHRPIDSDSKLEVAEDLQDYINGKTGRAGGLFSSGTSFKDFDGYASKYFKDYKGDISNDMNLLLSIFYDAADDCMDHYTNI